VKTVIKLPAGAYEDLVAHLLPGDTPNEQAAFLFAAVKVTTRDVAFDVIDSAKLVAADFEVQAPDHLELADGTRARLIKRAHDLDASLIEVHSHPGPWDAAFSRSDLVGLSETVPHMWWRLKKRPYAAIVIAPSGFDAMLWLDGPLSPQQLDSLAVGSRILRPTNITIRARHD
jgi:hypothetical protein